jgi:PAS domain S-box-containing protein
MADMPVGEKRRSYLNETELIDQVHDAVTVADPHGILVTWNAAAERIYGYFAAEMLGQNVALLFFPEDIGTLRDILGTLQTKDFHELMVRNRRKDGAEIFVDLRLSVVRDASGAPVRLIGCSNDITERKRMEDSSLREIAYRTATEQQLRASEARLREAQKIAQIGSWELNLIENVLVWTDEVFNIFEIDQDAFGASYETFLATIHPEDRDRVDAVYRRSVEERTAYEVTHRLLFPDGRIKHVRERGISFYGDDGRPIRSVGTVQDITELTLAEQALRQSEERYSLAVEATRDGIWEWNVATGYAYFSPRWKEIVEYAGVELPEVVSTFFDLLHPDDKPAVEDALDQHFAAKAPFSREFRLRRKDGTYCWVHSHGKAVRDSGGRPVRMVGSIRNITEQKMAAIRLAESEARLSLVFNSTSDFQALFCVKPGGRFVVEAVNRSLIEALREWIPAPSPEMVGQDVADFLSAAGVPKEKIALRLRTCQEVAEDRTPRHIDGIASGLPADVSIYPILDGENQCTHVLVVARSISDRQRAKQMEASLREKDTLLREVHHRVKNNLQIISSLLRFQSKKIVDPRDGDVFRQGQDRLRAMSLVHEHLYRSPSLSEVDFGEYTRSLAEQFASSQGEARDRIHLMVEAPKITVPAEIALPAGMVITELLSNAFKHAFPGQRTGSVTVRITRTKSAFAVSVEDDGIGMGAETSLGNADGFGLKMVRSLSQQLKGKLSYQTEAVTKITLEVPYEAH